MHTNFHESTHTSKRFCVRGKPSQRFTMNEVLDRGPQMLPKTKNGGKHGPDSANDLLIIHHGNFLKILKLKITFFLMISF